MTDPSDALQSFQKELLKISLQRGTIYSDLYLHFDQPDGKVRLTYVRLDGGTVIAYVSFIQHTPIDRTPCFQVGYAVPEAYRNRGLATETVKMALAEMEKGYRKTQLANFCVEAIVGTENKPSQRVAERTISATPVAIKDEISGLPALQYIRKIP